MSESRMQISDAELYTALYDAYDDMGPSDEAISRMFANIQQQTYQQTNQQARIVSYQNVKRRSRMKWQIVGSVAACLVVLAGVGAFVLTQSSSAQGGDPFSNVFSIVANDLAQEEAANGNGNVSADNANANQAANENAAEGANENQASEGNGDQPEGSDNTSTTNTAIVDTGAGEFELVAKDDASLAQADPSLVGDEIAIGVISLAPVEDVDTGSECKVYNYNGAEADFAVEVNTDGELKLFLAIEKPAESSTINSSEDKGSYGGKEPIHGKDETKTTSAGSGEAAPVSETASEGLGAEGNASDPSGNSASGSRE